MRGVESSRGENELDIGSVGEGSVGVLEGIAKTKEYRACFRESRLRKKSAFSGVLRRPSK